MISEDLETVLKLIGVHWLEMLEMKISLNVFYCVTDFKVCFISLHSLGVALSRGHGKYFFRGNVTVEEGKILSTSSHSWHSSLIVDVVQLKLVCFSADSIRKLDFIFLDLLLHGIFSSFIVSIVWLRIFFR